MSTNILHRVYLSHEVPADHFVKDTQMWKLLNPDWEVKVWGSSVFALSFDETTERHITNLFEIDGGNDYPETIEVVQNVIGESLVKQFGGLYLKSSVIPYILPGITEDFSD